MNELTQNTITGIQQTAEKVIISFSIIMGIIIGIVLSKIIKKKFKIESKLLKFIITIIVVLICAAFFYFTITEPPELYAG